MWRTQFQTYYKKPNILASRATLTALNRAACLLVSVPPLTFTVTPYTLTSFSSVAILLVRHARLVFNAQLLFTHTFCLLIIATCVFSKKCDAMNAYITVLPWSPIPNCSISISERGHLIGSASSADQMGLADILTGYSWVRCWPLVQLYCYNEVSMSTFWLGAVSELGEGDLEETKGCWLYARFSSIRPLILHIAIYENS